MGARVVVAIAAVGCGALACSLQNPDFNLGDGSASAASTELGESDPETLTSAATSAGEGTSGGASMGSSGEPTTGTTSASTTSTGTTGASTTGTTSTTSTSTTRGTGTDSTTGESGEPTTDTGGDEAPGACGIPLEQWSFVEVAVIAAISTPQFEGDPLLLADNRTLYYAGETAQFGDDIFVATRTAFGEPFTALGKASALGLNSPSGDSRVALSGDLLRVYFASNRPGGEGQIDVWFGGRLDDKLPFTGLVPLATINSAEQDFDPFISADERRLYFAPRIGESREIAVASRAAIDQPFAAPVALAVINDGAAAEANPSLTIDERVIVFTSTRAGNGDLYVASRPTSAGDFEAPQLLGPPVNQPGTYEGEGFVAEGDDGCELFFVSDRLGSWDIFRARIVGP